MELVGPRQFRKRSTILGACRAREILLCTFIRACEMLPALAMPVLFTFCPCSMRQLQNIKAPTWSSGLFISGRVIFFQPPILGRKDTENRIFPDLFLFFFGGGGVIWVYTGDMDLFQFNTFISIYFYYKLCPVTDFIIRIINLLGAESKLIGSFALIFQNTVLRIDVVTYLANWPCQAFSHSLLTT